MPLHNLNTVDRSEMEAWKNFALYLADCQAATAEELAMRKSTSKSDKHRHRIICLKIMNVLKNPEGLSFTEATDDFVTEVSNRCLEAANDLRIE